MNIDITKLLGQVDDGMLAEIGARLGLTSEQSVAAGRALMAHFGQGQEKAVAAAADAAAIGQDQAEGLLQTLIEIAKEKLGEGALGGLGGLGGALGNLAGGLFGKK